MHQKFNINRQYLSSKIFIPQPPQQGQVWTNLNITILPDYLVYIKNQLTKEEQMIISDYHLQTYLLQTSLKPHPKNDFDACTNQIITHLRNHPQFWVRKIGSQQQKLKMHLAIQQFHKDCEALEKQFEQNNQLKLQKSYQVKEGIKIIKDYTYEGNTYTKGAHRFSAVVYPWISNYIINIKVKQQLDKLQNSLKQKNQLSQFILQFTCLLASKAKTRIKQYQPPLSSNQQQFVNQIQVQLKLFIKYLQENNIDTRCLSNFKDYFVIANSLFILIKFINIKLSKHNTSKQNEIEMKMQMQMEVQNQLQRDQQKIEYLLADCVNRFVKKCELQIIIEWLLKGQYLKICGLIQLKKQCQTKSRQKWRGLLSSEAQLQAAFDCYNEIMNHPQNMNRMKYKLQGSEVGWSEEQYLKFLESFLQFFNVPTNNKRIALAMGKDIEPNHVKHVKGLYMRNMNSRIQNGEIGGGKKGTFESKIQFLKKDIQNFNMKWFKKQNKNKSKKLRRKRKRQTFDEEQQDSDY